MNQERAMTTDDLPDCSSVASTQECTGLMPTPPRTLEEQESYQDLYSMEIPKELPKEMPERKDNIRKCDKMRSSE